MLRIERFRIKKNSCNVKANSPIYGRRAGYPFGRQESVLSG
ncbi:hypothetical protein CryarDRAFT_3150 [Cryptosporangium arvum DSM 44712]|uniref:Uncharacterized protein n=1 Tax=Cryptosporangium arvum DSM 44712 TaxID=927661 RepID=A0A010Z3P6_9ACTN|nr:hypothetical protein CryarDRAFT_3150 [Cryptosporangium arvum DSM 44712]